MKSKLKKVLSAASAMVAIAALAVIPAAAEGSAAPVIGYTPINTGEIINQVRNWVCGVIVAVSVIYGCYELWQGFTDDQPSRRKQGITVLVIGITVPALIWAILSMINIGG